MLYDENQSCKNCRNTIICCCLSNMPGNATGDRWTFHDISFPNISGNNNEMNRSDWRYRRSVVQPRNRVVTLSAETKFQPGALPKH